MEKKHSRTPELVHPHLSDVRVGADRGRSKFNKCVPGHPPVCWLLSCALGHATLCGPPEGKAASLLSPGTTTWVAFTCATIPWATPSLSVSERCCWYLQQKVTFRFMS